MDLLTLTTSSVAQNKDPLHATTNVDLTIYMRVFLQRHTPAAGTTTYPDHDGTQVPVRAWTDLEWTRFTGRYQRETTRYWSGKFWLRTPDTVRLACDIVNAPLQRLLSI